MKPLSIEEWKKIKEKQDLVNEIQKILKVSTNQITEKLNKLISENNELKKEIDELRGKDQKD